MKRVKIALEIPVWVIRLGWVAVGAAVMVALVKSGGSIDLTIGGSR